jgi:DNA-binding NarL/FixJ family response regulator
MPGPMTGTPVAIFNSHAEFIHSLKDALEFLETHDPQVIVYDLPRPFERHWNFLRLLKQTHGLRKKAWILTTTDKKALDAAVGASGVIEIIFGEPYGVDEVVEAVRNALSNGRPVEA